MRRSPFVAAALVCAVSLLLSSGCGRNAQPEDRQKVEEDTAPGPDVAGGNVVPSVPTYTVEADFSNVEGGAALSALPVEAQRVLARNGFVVSTSPDLELYEAYLGNEAPFLTADSVFHAYHILLADTLSGLEENSLMPTLEALTRAAHEKAAGLRASAPSALARPADKALAFWATAHLLLDPQAEVEASIRDEVTAEVNRIAQGTFIGTLPGEQHTRDYTRYVPTAAYGESEQLSRYFRCNRFLTLTPLELETTEGVQTCALVTLALLLDDDARSRYEDLCRLTRFLAGEPEDVSPFDVLNAMRSVCGKSMAPARLADEEAMARLRDELSKLRQPAIADQPQDTPGADPSLGRGLRVLAPGVSICAEAFQALGESSILPSGEYIAHLLGNAAFQSDQSSAAVLAPARRLLDQAVADYGKGLDIHTASLAVLSKLSTAGGKGYPQFMNTPAWAIKTANTQLGAWSQVEHDVFLYAKDTTQYLCAFMMDKRFHGYVEPVPEYYADLANLVHRTRVIFDSLGAFEPSSRRAKAEAVRMILERLPAAGPFRFKTRADPEPPPQRRGVSATKMHYRMIEEMLLKLKTMSEKELENKPFDASEIRLLKQFGEGLKYLAFNESNLPHAFIPMSTVVCLAREYSRREGLCVGTGRPLEILVIVPWQGKLHWCTGTIYSYYEFMQPLSDPIADGRWKDETLPAFALQARRPWLCRFDVGLKRRTLSRDALAKWLPEESGRFGESSGGSPLWIYFGGGPRKALDELGFVELDAEAVTLATKAFAEQHHRPVTRCVLCGLLQNCPPELRKKTALQALSSVTSEVSAGRKADSIDYALWIYVSLRLLKDHADDPDVRAAIGKLRQLDGIDRVFEKCMEDAELGPLLKAAASDAG
ncbi:MAG: DUF3160 domain-containing protein [Verrucomicrobia bacterium]|nr:DUF3160 domain-containing protein [Verrucomicrobiota bacterium]